MSFVEGYLRRPHLVSALLMLAAGLGAIGYNRLPFKLFPDTERPQVAVVTVLPGASASDVESDLTRPIERELSGLDQVRAVRSTSRDEVSAVTVEFRYSRDLSSAATDVANAIEKIRSRFPPGTRPPILFRVSSATAAVMTVALHPKDGSHLDLSMVRQIAENQIRDRLLQLPEVANVEVFGGHQAVVRVAPDRDRLERYRLTVADVAAALAAANANQPAGLVINDGSQIVLKRRGALASVADVARVVLTDRGPGIVRVGDVAEVRRGVAEPKSAFHANGRPAIALNVQRQEDGNVLETITAVEGLLVELEREFPEIAFSVPDSQKEIITLSVSNMKDALKSSILMTLAVLFLFLASGRSLALVGVSLPMTFLLTFGVMWLGGMELNVVTLTAITLAVGMLVDDSIVVVENIQRHLDELGKPVRAAVVDGTKEILLADFAGTATTVLALTPIVFVGGYVQRVMQPLALTLIIALVSSFVISVTIIPLLAPWILRKGAGGRSTLPERLTARLADAVLGRLRRFYQGVVRTALAHRLLFLAVAAAMLVVAGRQLPLAGRDLMPSMDAGIIKIDFEADAGSSLGATEALLGRMEAILSASPEVISTSAVVGAEADVISFGSGRTPRQGAITVNLVSRFERERSIWEIEDALRRAFQGLPGLAQVDVYDFGATPLSTIKAPVDVMISGPDLRVLDAIGAEVERRLQSHLRGATSIGRSWRLDGRAPARAGPARQVPGLPPGGDRPAGRRRRGRARLGPAGTQPGRSPDLGPASGWPAGPPGRARGVPDPHTRRLRAPGPAGHHREAPDGPADHPRGVGADPRREGVPPDPGDLPPARGRAGRPGGAGAAPGLHLVPPGRDRPDERVVRQPGQRPGPEPAPAVLLAGAHLPVVAAPDHDHVGDPLGADRSGVDAADHGPPRVHARHDGDDPARRGGGEQLDPAPGLRPGGPGAGCRPG
ncbi:MAG: AcrB/AcrD/AcrF family protein [Deltaproteobacteria bacterium]|nr:AcrB/AcrD/AcrF family protein [Deltaproteobacteria bacterium]